MASAPIGSSMVRPADVEQAIREALEAAQARDYDRTLQHLAFAFARAATVWRERHRGGPHPAAPKVGAHDDRPAGAGDARPAVSRTEPGARRSREPA